MTETEVTVWAPSETTEAFQTLDRWFDGLAGRLGGFPRPGPAPLGPRLARTDLLETPVGFQIVTELPGVTKEQLELVVRGTTVEIRTKTETAVASAGPKYLHQERRATTFARYIELPEPVVPGQVKAALREGLLTVDLPKEHPEPVPTEVRVPVE
jgi:HSP20 family protein